MYNPTANARLTCLGARVRDYYLVFFFGGGGVINQIAVLCSPQSPKPQSQGFFLGFLGFIGLRTDLNNPGPFVRKRFRV